MKRLPRSMHRWSAELKAVIRNPTSLVGTFLVIFVMAIGLYRAYFQPSGIAAKTG